MRKLRLKRREIGSAGKSIIEILIDDFPIRFVEPGTVKKQIIEHSRKVNTGCVCSCGSPMFGN